MRGNLVCHNLAKTRADFDISTYVEINAAGNGYRGHGIAVPTRTYTQDFTSSSHQEVDNTQRYEAKDEIRC